MMLYRRPFKIFFSLLLAIAMLYACKQPVTANGNPVVVIETAFGDIEVELYTAKAPLTCTAFLQYVDSGWYNRSNFYRVLHFENQPSNAPKSELIQGGIWKSNNPLAVSVRGIPHETTRQTGILHKTGVISLARAEPGTAGTEFFICVDDEPGLDYGGENVADRQGYAAFGKVVKGMDVVRKIYRQRERNQYFDPLITIFSIDRK
ncbi:MAG TPA: peptidylprolyl isomerase [Sediminibacterium sp.]|nr:peptidylprolyl isomerase [Sediminibacterium sp.]